MGHGCYTNISLWVWSPPAIMSTHKIVVSVNPIAYLLIQWNYTKKHEIPTVTIIALNTVDNYKIKCMGSNVKKLMFNSGDTYV